MWKGLKYEDVGFFFLNYLIKKDARGETLIFYAGLSERAVIRIILWLA